MDQVYEIKMDHTNEIVNKSTQLVNIMKTLKFILYRETLETNYISFVRPVLGYGSPVWSDCKASDEEKLDSVQLNAAHGI